MATPKKKTEIAARPQQSERRATATPAAGAGLQPTREDVSLRAFQLWEEGGCQPGQELENWLRAERELLGPKQRN